MNVYASVSHIQNTNFIFSSFLWWFNLYGVQGVYIDQAAMLTEHKQTPLFKVTKLTQNTILPIILL